MQLAPAIILTTAALLAFTTGCEKKKRRLDATEEKTEEKKAEAKGPAGITDDEIVLGMSSSFQGSAAEIGIESYRGAMAYFAEVNASGGVNGRKLRIIPMDDSYDGAKAAANTDMLLKDRNVFVMFSAGGTGNTNGIVKALSAQKEPNLRDQAFLFGSTSGAQATRQLPNSQWVYHVRTSINQTTRAAVEAFLAGGKKKIGVFAQDDDFGQAVIEGARLAATDLKTTIAAEAKQPAGVGSGDDTVH